MHEPNAAVSRHYELRSQQRAPLELWLNLRSWRSHPKLHYFVHNPNFRWFHKCCLWQSMVTTGRFVLVLKILQTDKEFSKRLADPCQQLYKAWNPVLQWVNFCVQNALKLTHVGNFKNHLWIALISPSKWGKGKKTGWRKRRERKDRQDKRNRKGKGEKGRKEGENRMDGTGGWGREKEKRKTGGGIFLVTNFQWLEKSYVSRYIWCIWKKKR